MDGLFRPGAQQDVFTNVAAPLLQDLFEESHNCALITYGPPASGKSYSMWGPRRRHRAPSESGVVESSGLVQRAAKHIFDLIAQCPDPSKYMVAVAFFEITSDSIVDLIAKGVGVDHRCTNKTELVSYCNKLTHLKMPNPQAMLDLIQGCLDGLHNSKQAVGHLLLQLTLIHQNGEVAAPVVPPTRSTTPSRSGRRSSLCAMNNSTKPAVASETPMNHLLFVDLVAPDRNATDKKFLATNNKALLSLSQMLKAAANPQAAPFTPTSSTLTRVINAIVEIAPTGTTSVSTQSKLSTAVLLHIYDNPDSEGTMHTLRFSKELQPHTTARTATPVHPTPPATPTPQQVVPVSTKALQQPQVSTSSSSSTPQRQASSPRAGSQPGWNSRSPTSSPMRPRRPAQTTGARVRSNSMEARSRSPRIRRNSVGPTSEPRSGNRTPTGSQLRRQHPQSPDRPRPTRTASPRSPSSSYGKTRRSATERKGTNASVTSVTTSTSSATSSTSVAGVLPPDVDPHIAQQFLVFLQQQQLAQQVGKELDPSAPEPLECLEVPAQNVGAHGRGPNRRKNILQQASQQSGIQWQDLVGNSRRNFRSISPAADRVHIDEFAESTLQLVATADAREPPTAPMPTTPTFLAMQQHMEVQRREELETERVKNAELMRRVAELERERERDGQKKRQLEEMQEKAMAAEVRLQELSELDEQRFDALKEQLATVMKQKTLLQEQIEKKEESTEEWKNATEHRVKQELEAQRVEFRRIKDEMESKFCMQLQLKEQMQEQMQAMAEKLNGLNTKLEGSETSSKTGSRHRSATNTPSPCPSQPTSETSSVKPLTPSEIIRQPLPILTETTTPHPRAPSTSSIIEQEREQLGLEYDEEPEAASPHTTNSVHSGIVGNSGGSHKDSITPPPPPTTTGGALPFGETKREVISSLSSDLEGLSDVTEPNWTNKKNQTTDELLAELSGMTKPAATTTTTTTTTSTTSALNITLTQPTTGIENGAGAGDCGSLLWSDDESTDLFGCETASNISITQSHTCTTQHVENVASPKKTTMLSNLPQVTDTATTGQGTADLLKMLENWSPKASVLSGSGSGANKENLGGPTSTSILKTSNSGSSDQLPGSKTARQLLDEFKDRALQQPTPATTVSEYDALTTTTEEDDILVSLQRSVEKKKLQQQQSPSESSRLSPLFTNTTVSEDDNGNDGLSDASSDCLFGIGNTSSPLQRKPFALSSSQKANIQQNASPRGFSPPLKERMQAFTKEVLGA